MAGGGWLYVRAEGSVRTGAVQPTEKACQPLSSTYQPAQGTSKDRRPGLDLIKDEKYCALRAAGWKTGTAWPALLCSVAPERESEGLEVSGTAERSGVSTASQPVSAQPEPLSEPSAESEPEPETPGLPAMTSLTVSQQTRVALSSVVLLALATSTQGLY